MDIHNLIAPNFYALHLDIQSHQHTTYRLRGGRGSLKTSTIIIEILLIMQKHPEICAVVFMKHSNRLRHGIFAAFNEQIARARLTDLYDVSLSPLRIINKVTGQVILFLGLDEPGKTKSLNTGSPDTYFGITYFNELDQFNGNREIDTAIDSIVRGGDLSWCFQDYNPPANANNWVNKDSLVQVPGRLIHSSDYRTVPVEWLGKAFIEKVRACYLASEREYRWRYLGEVVGIEGLVFRNVHQYDLSQGAPSDFILQGIDVGYEDPMAFVRIGINLTNRDLYFLDEYYQNHVMHEDVAEYIAGKQYNDVPPIIESAGAGGKFAQAVYSRYGVPSIIVNKGNDLKMTGIHVLESFNHIYIDPNVTPNVWEEFNLYEWKKDKNGQVISPECPVDYKDHTIDATRYAISRHIGLLGGLT